MSEQLPWYELDPVRLVTEQSAMKSRFPQFRLLRQDRDLYWDGYLVANHGKKYRIVVRYPNDYPARPPKVYPIDPVIEIFRDEQAGVLQHQYNDGELCLFHPNDRFFERKSTVVTVVAAAATWFAAYEYWEASGRTIWPGKEAEHKTRQ
jgi:ubiquitin-protein ligase